MSGCGCGSNQAEALERKTLKLLLFINAFMFVLEIITGIMAQSTGLIADSLDMLADASVYAISFFAVGISVSKQADAAKLSGYLQVILGFAVLAEVLRRVAFGTEPESSLMITIGFLALVANLVCLVLISPHKEGGVHMRASWIFSANDVIANAGVIIAGLLVAYTGSSIPDLLIGTIVSIIVVRGGMRILKEAKQVLLTRTDT